MWAQPRVPQLRLGGAEDAAVVLQVGAAVAGVLHVQRVIQQVQVFLDLGDVLCGVLLRVQDLREARGVRLRDRREETARPPGTLPPASPCRPQASRRGLQSPGHLAQLSPQPGKPALQPSVGSTMISCSERCLHHRQICCQQHWEPGAGGHRGSWGSWLPTSSPGRHAPKRGISTWLHQPGFTRGSQRGAAPTSRTW